MSLPCITATIVLPPGYKTAEEFAADCGFDLAIPAKAEAEYNPAYDDGITYAICQLAELTGSKDWQMRDGSEDHETDVRDTIMDVLKCAGLFDDETGKFASLPAVAVSREEVARELL